MRQKSENPLKPFRVNVVACLLGSLLLTSLNSSAASSLIGVEWDDQQFLAQLQIVEFEASNSLWTTQGVFNALDPATRIEMKSAFLDTLLRSDLPYLLVIDYSLSDGMVKLLKVNLVPDINSPHGFAFNVEVMNTSDGALLATLYTYAVPSLQKHGAIVKYVAGANGYEKKTIKPQSSYSVSDIGITLAREVIKKLSQ